MKIEENIELAMQDILQARAYIIAQSIPVVRYRDRLTVKGDAWVNVHCEPLERLSNNHDLYRGNLVLMAESKSQEDLRSNAIDGLIADLMDEINETLTAATLQTAINTVQASSGIAIAGHSPLPGTEGDGEYQFITAETEIALTYTKPIA